MVHPLGFWTKRLAATQRDARVWPPVCPLSGPGYTSSVISMKPTALYSANGSLERSRLKELRMSMTPLCMLTRQTGLLDEERGCLGEDTFLSAQGRFDLSLSTFWIDLDGIPDILIN